MIGGCGAVGPAPLTLVPEVVSSRKADDALRKLGPDVVGEIHL